MTKNLLFCYENSNFSICGPILANFGPAKNFVKKIDCFNPIQSHLTEKCGFLLIREFQNFQNLIIQNIPFLQFLAFEKPLNGHKWPKNVKFMKYYLSEFFFQMIIRAKSAIFGDFSHFFDTKLRLFQVYQSSSIFDL